MKIAKSKKPKRVNLTITICKSVEEKLRVLIAPGEISKFVGDLLWEKLLEMEKNVISQYRDKSQDEELNEETKSWFLVGGGMTESVN